MQSLDFRVENLKKQVCSLFEQDIDKNMAAGPGLLG